MRIVKPYTDTWNEYHRTMETIDRPATLLWTVRNLLSGNHVTFEGYDSEDDPMSLVDKHVAVKWNNQMWVSCARCFGRAPVFLPYLLVYLTRTGVCRPVRWYTGRIVAYDSGTCQHKVVYNDDDVRSYVLSCKPFVLTVPNPKQVRAVAECVVVARGALSVTHAGCCAALRAAALW